MACRRATHAGSWYTEDANELSEELDAWLEEATAAVPRDTPDHARAIIAPHAGYRYSGRCAAYAFSQINPSKVKRVFLLGPSHHYYTRRCALSNLSTYKTPLGDISIDAEIYSELRATGEFEEMTSEVDEAEHSMEMHLPYIYKVFAGRPFTLVPILVGSASADTEERYGRLLSRYLDDPQNLFCISSDFCHWGQRFGYTYYDKKQGPIYKSIEALDRDGMDIIETGDPASFTAYLRQYENTICGRHPIGVLLHALQHCRTKMQIRFNQYEQSSRCKSVRDSSVSYASAVAIPLRPDKPTD